MQSNKKYRDKYRVDTCRAKWWDYSQPSFYFITICIKKKSPLFGEINKGRMILSEQGRIVQNHWLKIPDYYNGLVSVDEFIVMPDHFHGIVKINDIPNNDGTANDGTANVDTPNVDTANDGTANVDTPNVETPFKGVSTLAKTTLGQIINQFKRGVTIEIRKINPSFKWQARYHDIIIQNPKALNNIRRYIKNNPQNG